MKRVLLLVLLVAPLAACGNPLGTGPVQGKVTAMIPPKGSVECSGPLATSCGSDDSYKVIIEPLPGHKDVGGGWTDPYAEVCLPPSVWRKTHLGSVYDDRYTHGDLHCDG